MKTRLSLLLLLMVCLFLSCKKQPDPIPLNSEKELTDFRIEAEKNFAFIKETIKGNIEGSGIKLVIRESVNATSLIATFSFKGQAVFVGLEIQRSGETANDFTRPFRYLVKAEDGTEKAYDVKIEIIPETKNAIPHIYIDTENGAPINSKETYINASIRIDGVGIYDNYEGKTSIKGRGNTTWYYPKKPYRLKLDSKAPLLGLAADKDWILLANYLDETLMLNAVAFKTGQLLEMPFTNHAVPVDVTINGIYVGNYMFTEQKEVDDNRINIGEEGVLLELDTNFDEPWQFNSTSYNLPVMIQHPNLEKLPADQADLQFQKIKNDFENFERLIYDPSYPFNNYRDFFDTVSFVKYWIVYDFTLNREINHPKSTLMYKTTNGKYCMGPVWDFDWGFGFDGISKHFEVVSLPLMVSGDLSGALFFRRIMESSGLRKLYKQEWTEFKTAKLPELLKYIDDYAETIKDSYSRDYKVWKTGEDDLAGDVRRLKDWLNARAAYIDSNTATW